MGMKAVRPSSEQSTCTRARKQYVHPASNPLVQGCHVTSCNAILTSNARLISFCNAILTSNARLISSGFEVTDTLGSCGPAASAAARLAAASSSSSLMESGNRSHCMVRPEGGQQAQQY